MAGGTPRLVIRRFAGLVPYARALELQEELAAARAVGGLPDTLLALQHPPVFTVGKRGVDADVLASPAALAALGATVHHAPRGGEVTYHGPGQAVLYPIVALRELAIGAREYVEGLEDSMIATLALHGVAARGRVPGRTGVWVGDERPPPADGPASGHAAGSGRAGPRKIGAVGVRVARGITTHGLALNIAPDLAHFGHIVPCGLADIEVTSLQRELERRAVGALLRRPAHPDDFNASADFNTPSSVAAQAAAAQASAGAAARVDVEEVVGQLVAAFVARFGYGRVDHEQH